MSNFGRYFGQLQFFTVLTVYCFWLTIRGAGPINRRALWATALSFSAMFLTWEGSALIAPGMVLAALVQRRGRLGTVLRNLSVWVAMLVVVLLFVAQYSFRALQQTQSLWYGISASDAMIAPMWPYPIYQPWFYIWESSWNQDALLPLLALLGAALLAVWHRHRRPLQYLLLIYLTLCIVMAALLTLFAWRYGNHLIPLLILPAAAVPSALFSGLVKLVRGSAALRATASPSSSSLTWKLRPGTWRSTCRKGISSSPRNLTS
jgi:4-amino-4-deoxy-L-arabinose transferase-like glycosyltransferase